MSRAVTRDVEIGGKRVEAGQVVIVLLAAANRDPDRFPEPDRLVLYREPNPHLAFGRGPHSCLGFRVGLIEARSTVATIVDRYPGLQLAGEPVRRRNATLRGLRQLPVTLGASR